LKKRTEICWVLLFVLGVGCARVPAAPKDGSSAHFEETAAHLHLGGTMYTYLDIDGDLARGTALLDDIIKSSDEIPSGIRTMIDTNKWARMLGLDRIDAVGLSSYAQAEGYVNRAFIHHTQERAGMLKVGGDGDPHPFEVLALAPADSAMVFETDINLSAVTDVVLDILKDAGGEYAAAALLAKLQELMMPTDIEVGKFLDSLDTKVMGVLRIDKEKRLHIPNEELTLPVMDLMLVIDDFGFLFDSIVHLAADSPLFFHDVQEEYEILEIRDSFPGDFDIYKPILRKDKKTGRIYLAARRSYLETCLAQKSSVRDAENFVQATEGLPIAAGNGITYISTEFSDTLREITQSIMKDDDDLQWLLPVVGKWFPKIPIGRASVRVNYDNGTLFASNAAYSHKMTLLAAMAVNPVTIGMFGAIAIPAVLRARDRVIAEDTEPGPEPEPDSYESPKPDSYEHMD
jgi:hypothetical protein